jgi:hypothetical protein
MQSPAIGRYPVGAGGMWRPTNAATLPGRLQMIGKERMEERKE